MNRRLATLLLQVCLAGFAWHAHGDDIQPLYIAISDEGAGNWIVEARIPPQISPASRTTLVLPGFCGDRLALSTSRQRIYCSADLAGTSLAIEFSGPVVPTPAIVRVSYAGQSHTLLLDSGERQWRLPARETTSSVAREYTWLGMHHIWVGADHLLFLACLMWIARTWRRMVVTVTGFTLAHSVTLALSALNLLRVPIPPTEAVIALSVLFLAREVMKGERDSLAWRYPVFVSTTFGLLHGLGFAAVLKEIGLPQQELVTGLICFNIGVEIGQLVFVGAIVLLLAAVRRITDNPLDPRRLLYFQHSLAWVVGGISAFWVIERSAGFILH